MRKSYIEQVPGKILPHGVSSVAPGLLQKYTIWLVIFSQSTQSCPPTYQS